MGLSGEERGQPGGGSQCTPLAPIRIGQGEGAAGPLSFLLCTSSFPLLLVGIGKGGANLLGVGLPALGAPPPSSFIYGGGGEGTPKTHQLIF